MNDIMVRVEFERWGEIKVDGHIFYSDMIVWWDGDKDFIAKDHVLGQRTFSRLLRKKPDMIVVGRGQQSRVMIADDVRALAGDKGIKLFEEDTGKAVDIFNGLVSDGKRVVLMVHTTC